MTSLFGKSYSKKELLERVGDISQVGGVRHMKLVGGSHDWVDVVEFRTGSGLRFLAVPGRGLDISIAEYKGTPLAWRSGAGEVSSSLYEEPGLGWIRSFAGGLVATCGLTYVGAPCEDNGNKLGLHGRVSNTPASNLCVDYGWDGDDYRMWATGRMREYCLKGEDIELKRTISAVLGQNKIWIDDVVTNLSPRRTPHMMLYHINGGFPVVEAGSRFVSSTRRAQPVDDDAKEDMAHFYLNDPPTRDRKDRCYYHDMATDSGGFAYAALVNKNLPEQLGFCVKYKKSELPMFTQWKVNALQEYVVGMEPANCGVEGRAKERERGTLQFLEPGEVREYHLEISVLSGSEEITDFERHLELIK